MAGLTSVVKLILWGGNSKEVTVHTLNVVLLLWLPSLRLSSLFKNPVCWSKIFILNDHYRGDLVNNTLFAQCSWAKTIVNYKTSCVRMIAPMPNFHGTWISNGPSNYHIPTEFSETENKHGWHFIFHCCNISLNTAHLQSLFNGSIFWILQVAVTAVFLCLLKVPGHAGRSCLPALCLVVREFRSEPGSASRLIHRLIFPRAARVKARRQSSVRIPTARVSLIYIQYQTHISTKCFLFIRFAPFFNE